MTKTKVPVFDCEVRHGGDIGHSQPKLGVTEREIRVLRAIHGEDGVVQVKEAGEKEVDQREEVFELAVRYSKNNQQRYKHGRRLVQQVLGVPTDGMDKWLQEREQLAELERQERRERQQRESAMFNAARAAAEADVRARLAHEKVPA